MIVVTGASGQLGSAIARELVERVPAHEIGVSVRDVEKASGLAALGIRVRHGDFAEPATLAHAFEGATQVLVVSSNGRATGQDPLAQHRAAIDAARAAGAKRIVYTSHMAVSATSAFGPMHDHAATEAMLAQCGMAWTSLRNGFYASSALVLVAPSFETGRLEAPLDGPVSWTTHDDLAEAAAIVLAKGGFDGPTPPLTASEALDLADLARIASSILGRTITRTVITDEALRERLAARGMPPRVADIALGLYVASRAGEFRAVDPTLARLLGRAPKTMEDVLRAHRRA